MNPVLYLLCGLLFCGVLMIIFGLINWEWVLYERKHHFHRPHLHHKHKE